MPKMLTSRIEKLEKLKLFHLTVHKDVLQSFHKPEDKGSVFNQRFIVRVNDQIEWSGGTVSLGEDQAYITISSSRMKELGVNEGDIVEYTLTRDDSEYGMPVPVEFETVLDQDPEGKRRFEILSKGKRRNIIYLVNQFKTSDKRIEKSLFFIENLKRCPEDKFSMRAVLGKEERE